MLKEKLPSTSVIVPIVVPFTDTFAPIIASPFSSVIMPLTVFLFAVKPESLLLILSSSA